MFDSELGKDTWKLYTVKQGIMKEGTRKMQKNIDLGISLHTCVADNKVRKIYLHAERNCTQHFSLRGIQGLPFSSFSYLVIVFA